MKKEEKKELKRLERENTQLKKELAAAEKRLRKLQHDNENDELALEVSGIADHYNKANHYLGFLFRSLRTSGIYSRIKKLVKLFSRFRVISFTVKAVTYIVTFIETGAHVLLFSTIALISLPISTVFGLFTIAIALIGSNRATKRLAHIPDGKKVYIFFPQKVKQFKGETFFNAWVRETAAQENSLVLIVSPAFWKSSGYLKGKYYLHYRQDGENIFMLRKYYFFTFKRNVLKNVQSDNIVVIH